MKQAKKLAVLQPTHITWLQSGALLLRPMHRTQLADLHILQHPIFHEAFNPILTQIMIGCQQTL